MYSVVLHKARKKDNKIIFTRKEELLMYKRDEEKSKLI